MGRADPLIWLLLEALSESDEFVTGSLQLLDGVREDLSRGCRDCLVVQGKDGGRMLADHSVVSVLALLSRDAKRVARTGG